MMNKRKSSAKWPSFIKILFEILENPENSSILYWSEDGESIVLKDSAELVNSLLPKYFKHSNLSSFIRQLNMYDFHKSLLNQNASVYSHPFFKRGKEGLYRKIKRKAKKEEEESDSMMIEKQQIAQIKQKMSKLSEKEEKLQIENEKLLQQRDKLLKIRDLEQKEYEAFLEDFHNRNNKNQEQSQPQSIPLLQNECKQDEEKAKVEHEKQNEDQKSFSYNDRLSFTNYVRAKLKNSKIDE